MPTEGKTRELTLHPQDQSLLSSVTGESSFARVSRIFKQWAKCFIQVTEQSCRRRSEALVQLLDRTVGQSEGEKKCCKGGQTGPMKTAGSGKKRTMQRGSIMAE
jgi:hypothetical protein